MKMKIKIFLVHLMLGSRAVSEISTRAHRYNVHIIRCQCTCNVCIYIIHARVYDIYIYIYKYINIHVIQSCVYYIYIYKCTYHIDMDA